MAEYAIEDRSTFESADHPGGVLSSSDLPSSRIQGIRTEKRNGFTGITEPFPSPEEIHKTEHTLVDLTLLEGFQANIPADRRKKINRAITRSTMKPKTKRALIKERTELVAKKYKEGLALKEEKRLTFVRWQLDRIDDAENGEELDLFERELEVHEQFADNLNTLLSRLESEQEKPRYQKRQKRRKNA